MGQRGTKPPLEKDLLESAGRPVITVKEAGRLSGLGESVVRDAIDAGELPLLQRVPKGNVSILVRDLAAWLLNQRHYRRERA